MEYETGKAGRREIPGVKRYGTGKKTIAWIRAGVCTFMVATYTTRGNYTDHFGK
jgi:hypothetical protein